MQRIMIDNIDAALNRGELISGNGHLQVLKAFHIHFSCLHNCEIYCVHLILLCLFVTDLADKTRTLAMESKVYAKEAKYLNLRTSLAAKAAIVVVFVLILVFLRFWLF